MRNKLTHLKTNLFGAGLEPGGAGEQLYLKAQTISVAMMVTVTASLAAAALYYPYSSLLCRTHAANAVLCLAAYLIFRRNPDPTFAEPRRATPSS